MKNNEIWRPVEGYEGLYEVSDLGRVRSIGWNNLPHYCGGVRKRKGVILIPSKTGPERNYMRVQLCREGTVVRSRIHRLVARAFPEICGEWFDGCDVHHLNENTFDNRAVNLKVCKHVSNCNYGTRNNRIALKQIKSVNQYTLEGEFVRFWEGGANEIKDTLGICKGLIQKCCAGLRSQTHGFKWQYA